MQPLASLKAKQGGTISQKDLGELQRESAAFRARSAHSRARSSMQQINLDGGMGKFGEQQGKLGGQMGELGATDGPDRPARIKENQNHHRRVALKRQGQARRITRQHVPQPTGTPILNIKPDPFTVFRREGRAAVNSLNGKSKT